MFNIRAFTLILTLAAALSGAFAGEDPKSPANSVELVVNLQAQDAAKDWKFLPIRRAGRCEPAGTFDSSLCIKFMSKAQVFLFDAPAEGPSEQITYPPTHGERLALAGR
jgi:hypothetical protein